MSDFNDLITLVVDSIPSGNISFSIFLLLLAALSFVLVRFPLVWIIYKMLGRAWSEWDDILKRWGVFRQFAYLAPGLVFYFGAARYPEITEVARQIVLAYIILNLVIILDRMLSAGLEIYRLYPFSETHPIKPYIQLANLLLFIMGAVGVISVLLGKSPWGLLGGIGAASAILILIFRDTLVSLVASIQMAANDLVRRGDWIELPEYGADGEVIDISLHTVKVQNWDKTIITVPTNKLVEGSFQNWRGMTDAGGRRIKRSLLIDQASIRFCDGEMIDRLRRIDRLRPYFDDKLKDLESANAGGASNVEELNPLNRRTLTNLGTFRAYASVYLEENAKLRNDMTFMVRQRAPSPHGLPLEIYVFTRDTAWVNFEGIQADIFDHLLAAVSFFDLRLFQNPTGHDLQSLNKQSFAQNL